MRRTGTSLPAATHLAIAGAILIASGCGTTAATLPPADPTLSTGFVEVGGDTRLYYEEMGEGRPIVLLHGGFLDRRMWDKEFQALAETYRVVRYDARNHGKSETGAGEFTHYGDLSMLLAELEVEDPILIGLSLGGRTVLDFVIAYPDRASAIVLASPGAGGFAFASEALQENSRRMGEAFRESDLPQAVEYFQRSWTDGPARTPTEVDPEVREQVRSMAIHTTEGWNLGSVAKDLDPPAARRLGEIRIPALVICGDLDMPGILQLAEQIERQVDGARVAVIPGVAHMVNLEAPGEFDRILRGFLETTTN